MKQHRMNSRISAARQMGVSLVEILVSLVIGLLLIAFIGSAYLAQSGSSRSTDEAARLQETARIATNLLERAVRQAGFVEYGQGQSPQGYCSESATTPDVGGVPPPNGPFIEGRSGSGHFANSDRLVLRFFGAGPGTMAGGDGSIRDCRGVSVPGQALAGNAVNWFFVADDADGQPALFCGLRVPGAGAATTTQALVPGVESFQVLFLQTDGTSSAPRRLMRADEVTDWRRVVAVRLSLMIRGDIGSRTDLDSGPSDTQPYYDMFDPDYTARGSADAGRQFDPSTLSTADRRRLRRAFTTTVELRNSPATVCS